MRSLVLESPGRLVTAHSASPDQPSSGQALVRVHRVGVCGTDVHAFNGRQPFFTYPRILGHELGVEVLAVGEGVTHLSAGDRCAVEPYLNCGRCVACRRGKPNCCRALSVLGVHVDGGLRDQMLVPADKLHPSVQLSYDQLALVETLGIGAHAVARAQVGTGETVGVIGAGPIGLAAIQFALAAGSRVIVVDVNPDRLAFCGDHLRLAPDALVDARAADVTDRLRDLSNGDLPDVVLDATGNATSMANAFEYPAHGGRLVFIGLFPGNLTFNDPSFHRRELTVLASRNSLSQDFTRIISLIESGKVDTSPWITHRAPIEEVPSVFESWTRPDTSVVKAMIEL